MIYYTSDLHLGHDNSIALCNRPFESVEQMDEALIDNWNCKVKNGDTVYIVGDLVWQNVDPLKYLKRLNGCKYLIAGNHDIKWLKKLDMAIVDQKCGVTFRAYEKYFVNISQYAEIKSDKTIALCHYPMLEWKSSRKLGSKKKLGFHIHGHIHNSTDEQYVPLFLLPHALNACADINGYAPVTFDELEKNNEKFKLSALENQIDKAKFLSSKYHMYQTDISDKPYIVHPTAVASFVSGEKEKCVAYLHDILEHTDIDVKLLEDNFSQEIVESVKAMTHDNGVDYFDYIKTVSKNALARKVKLADLAHDMDVRRYKTLTDDVIARLEKYKKAHAFLTDAGTGD